MRVASCEFGKLGSDPDFEGNWGLTPISGIRRENSVKRDVKYFVKNGVK